jgi:NADPH:quinone reductase-like Zn-dependent oxidoreductase
MTEGGEMKTWQLHGFGRENLKLNDVPEPKAGPTEVLVRVGAASLNYRDKLIVEGFYNPSMRFPLTQVADAVGHVVDVGEEVVRLRIGDRVIANYCTRWVDGPPQYNEGSHSMGNTIPGALAEYFVLDQHALVKVPDYLSDDEAASVGCAGLTAWYPLVEKGQLKADQTVLIQGTGGVSIFGLQIASALGARVFVTSSSDAKLERAKALGASGEINYTRTPEWEGEVLKLTAQEGVDHILEVAGGKSLPQSVAAVKPGGQIAVIGVLDDISSDIPIFSLLLKQVVLRGVSVGPTRSLEDMLRKFEQLQLHPVIDSVYPFSDAVAAYDHLYRGAFGKIVIRVKE